MLVPTGVSAHQARRPRAPLPVHSRYVYLARVGSLRDGAVCGTILNPPGAVHGPIEQRWYQLVLIEAGDMRVDADGDPTRVAAGEVALLIPGQRVVLSCAVARETRHSWLTVSDPQLPPERTALLRAAPRSLPTSSAMAQLMQTGLALDESLEDEALQTALASVVTAALALYVEEARTRGSLAQQSGQHSAISTARRQVRQQLHEPLSVAALAEAAHVTPDYLTRLFRREMGVTPMRYVWQERVRLGIDLLEHTALPVAEVALRSGFQTANHFSRLVRAATGTAPRDVRRRRAPQPAI